MPIQIICETSKLIIRREISKSVHNCNKCSFSKFWFCQLFFYIIYIYAHNRLKRSCWWYYSYFLKLRIYGEVIEKKTLFLLISLIFSEMGNFKIKNKFPSQRNWKATTGSHFFFKHILELEPWFMHAFYWI